MPNNIKKYLLIITFLASACSDGWLGESNKKVKATGKRVSIFEFDNQIKINKSSAKVTIPRSKKMLTWANSNNSQHNNAENIAFSGKLSEVNEFQINDYLSNKSRFSTAIAAKGKIFILDGKSRIHCFDENNLSQKLWTYKSSNNHKKITSSGGISYEQGVIFATIGHRRITAVNAENGKLIWETNLANITKSAPFISKHQIFVMTSDNKIYGIGKTNGKILWSKEWGAERTSIIGNTSVSTNENNLFIPTSHGEIHTVNLDTKESLWSTSLSNNSGFSSSFVINDIDNAPVIRSGKVFVASQSDAIFALNEKNGARLWEQKVKGPKSLWKSGNMIFVIDSLNRVIALNEKNGNFTWVKEFPIYSNEAKNKKILLSGPIMVGSKLLISSNQGELISLSPKNGEILSKIKIDRKISTQPIAYNNKIYIVSDDGYLITVK